MLSKINMMIASILPDWMTEPAEPVQPDEPEQPPEPIDTSKGTAEPVYNGSGKSRPVKENEPEPVPEILFEFPIKSNDKHRSR